MIQKFIILLMVSIFLFSCQNDSLEETLTGNPAKDAVPVKFSFAIPYTLENQTEYVPMSNHLKAQDENLYQIKISNGYKAIITKKIGSKWIVDQVLTFLIDDNDIERSPNMHSVKNGIKVDDFSVVLRPGEYRITLITGTRAMNWYGNLKQGLIVDDEDVENFNVPMACVYRKIDSGYFHTDWYGLEEEIFSGYKDFEVKKTEDLHSPSNIGPVHLKLNRMVTKVRVALNNTPYQTGSYNFPTSINNTISAHLNTDDPKGFPTGLNIWGEVHYNSYTPELRYAVYAGKDEIEYMGEKYLLPYKGTMRQFTTFFFGDPNKDIIAKVSNITVTFQQGNTNFWTDDVFPMVMRNNYITGFILKPGNYSEIRNIEQPGGGVATSTYNEVLVEYESGNNPKNPAGLFDYNIEYR